MMVQIIPKGCQDFQWMKEEDTINEIKVKTKTDSMTVDELKAAVNEFESCYTYVADHIIDDSDNVITHNRIASSIPAICGTSVKSGFVFHGDTLILQTLATKRKLVSIRQK